MMENDIDLSNAVLFADSSRGVYIPKHFADSVVRSKVSGIDLADLDTLQGDMESDSYWDAWTHVLDNATVTDDDGTVYRLYQDGDLWLVPELPFEDDFEFLELFESYKVAALWSSSVEGDTSDGQPLYESADSEFSTDDLTPETESRFRADCAAFFKAHRDTIESATVSRGSGEYSKFEQAGHDLWLTQNGHGAGFWDGDWSEPHGDKLDSWCKSNRIDGAFYVETTPDGDKLAFEG